MGMEKLKFWLVAIAFILFLWFLSPDAEENNDLITESSVIDKGKVVLEVDPTTEPQPQKFKTAKVTITTKRGNLPLVLGFAYTPEQQRMGLMFYRVWPRNIHGLLFLFKKEDEYSMWMHRTYLPLDMVFIDRNGYITQIERNTAPESETPIKSKLPVLAILEIPAGSADKWKLQKGDQLRLKYFHSALPSG